MKSTEYDIVGGTFTKEECDITVKTMPKIFYLKGTLCSENEDGKCVLCMKEEDVEKNTYKCTYDEEMVKITCENPNTSHNFTTECIASDVAPILEVESLSLHVENEGD